MLFLVVFEKEWIFVINLSVYIKQKIAPTRFYIKKVTYEHKNEIWNIDRNHYYFIGIHYLYAASNEGSNRKC
jgi:hypothetical protein